MIVLANPNSNLELKSLSTDNFPLVLSTPRVYQDTAPLNLRFYEEVDHFAIATRWVHGFMARYARLTRVKLLVLTLLVAW
ncbi:hypothetical protein SAMN02745225_01458 [Ferrithrix thermotolerans DSM 19514]|uniref:Uncharacterized protein n=1 Tax=Ferrithrix thermotolerans DSM 19514 TaxID=1121881 RepID=A0A1M4VWN4_9ACTN|nr:hypothetical protein SAMN02745225_01458 [Ferrithrix thermotolerans DSM 19514]